MTIATITLFIMIFIDILLLGYILANHGKTIEYKFNFYASLLTRIISIIALLIIYFF